MTFTDFVTKLQSMEDDYNEEIDRKFNVNTCTKYPRRVSRYLTYFLYKLRFVKGPHVLLAHSASDLISLYFVYVGEPLYVLGFLLLSHLFDNCDGDLARIRNEADPKWGEIDVHLHLITNMAFWVIIGFHMLEPVTIYMLMALLAARVICESHRSEKEYSKRWGERSRLWYWLVLPTNVNIMYLSYVPFALAGLLDVYVGLYAVYYYSIALGQSLRKCLT